MKNVGVIGLGDMGSGIALNLIKNGFKVFGSDLLPARQEAFKKMGLGVYTGKGGFYHWLELPEGLNSKEFNKRLFKRGAAILCASECDMARPHDKELLKDYQTPYDRFFRFSFGPLLPETFESDVTIMREVLEQYKSDAGVQ